MIDFQKTFQLSKLTVAPATDTLSLEAESIEIQSMAMKILSYLASHEGQLVTRDELRMHVWNSEVTADHTINNHIYSLRRALAKLDPDNKYIHTVTGTNGNGYRLNGQISQTLEQPSIQDNNTNVTDSDSVQNVTAKAPHFSKLTHHRAMIISTCALVFSFIFYLVVLQFFIPVNYHQITKLTAHEGREQSPTLSEDGQVLIYANRVNRDKKWQLYASHMNNLASSTKVLDDPLSNDNFVSISPDKKYIAFIRYQADSRGIYIAEFDSNSLTAKNATRRIELSVHNLSPSINWLNNNEFFYNAKETPTAPLRFYLYNIALNTSEQISSPAINSFGDLTGAISPDKKWLALMRSDGAFGYRLNLLNTNTRDIEVTDVSSNEMRTGFSFSDDSQHLYFINEQGFLSQFDLKNKQTEVISDKQYIGYWPLKVPGKSQFIMQQDWGLSSLTTQIIKHHNPLKGGDGVAQVIVKNNMSIRAIEGIGNGDLIFASIKSNYQVQLWQYKNGQASILSDFNEKPEYSAPLSLSWDQGSNRALLSLNNTCRLININTGKDTPLCAKGENLFAGRFSFNNQSIYLAGLHHDKPIAVNMNHTGYPLTEFSPLNNANTIMHIGEKDFYYSQNGSYDIYHYNSDLDKHTKLISRTYVSSPHSINDFVVTTNGIYFMDRVKIRKNAIYYYDFKTQTSQLVIYSKDNYPNIVLSDDEQYIYLIQSYDNDSSLLLIE